MRPAQTNGRLKDAILGLEGYFGKGSHVFDMVQEVKAAYYMIVFGDHLPCPAHDLPALRGVTEHICRAYQDEFLCVRSEFVPVRRLFPRICHTAQHPYMVMGSAPVFYGDISAPVYEWADQPV